MRLPAVYIGKHETGGVESIVERCGQAHVRDASGRSEAQQ